MKPTMYGIKNCDTIKKARVWFEANGIDYDFHDYKIQGIDADRVRRWAAEVGWEHLMNRAGTTFRNLPDTEKQDIGEAKAIVLMLSQPSLIRRPVIETADGLLVGFDAERYRVTLL